MYLFQLLNINTPINVPELNVGLVNLHSQRLRLCTF